MKKILSAGKHNVEIVIHEGVCCNPNIINKLTSEDNKDWVKLVKCNVNMMKKTESGTVKLADNIKLWYSNSMLDFSDVLDVYKQHNQVSLHLLLFSFFTIFYLVHLSNLLHYTITPCRYA